MPSSVEYAALSQDSYRDRVVDPNVVFPINGVNYRVLATANNRDNGYQGTVYQRVDTREIVVAHRGTEPSNGIGEFWRDVVRTDGGMAINATNNQSPDAIALTQRAVDLAREEGERSGRTPPVTTTGHSLGGTLAQITAHRLGLHGETFNAYGAAGLNMGVPAGGDDMINHVRASDTVSAASPQYGQTRVYATPDDISALEDAGYANNRKRSFVPLIGDFRDPTGVVIHRGLAAHDISAFSGPGSIMTPENSERARRFDPMIDKFRDDIGAVRSGITGTSQGVQHGIQRVRDGWNDLFSDNRSMPRGGLLAGDDPMLAQTVNAIERDPTLAGMDNRAVASIAANARAQGLQEVDFVARGENGTLFAIQGDTPANPAARRATVDVDSQQQPLQASSQMASRGADAPTPTTLTPNLAAEPEMQRNPTRV